jgi:hypothetical protein
MLRLRHRNADGGDLVMSERRACIIALVLWLILMSVSGADHWGWVWTAFFAFAAGERWHDLGSR